MNARRKTAGADAAMAKRNDVGYCRPPKEKQFKKGQSGNPKGRPKGTPNLVTALTKTLSEFVEIEEEDGSKITVTKMEASVRRLVDQALGGDLQAFRVLMIFNQAMQGPESSLSAAELEAADQKVLDMLVRRFPTGETSAKSSLAEAKNQN